MYISTTDLRTKTPLIVETLKRGEKITLLHRSKLMGLIVPQVDGLQEVDSQQKKINRKKNFESFMQALKEAREGAQITTDEKREQIYRKHITKKYGKDFS